MTKYGGYNGCYQIHYPFVGNYFQIFTLLTIRALYTPAQAHVTHTASLEARPHHRLGPGLAWANGI